MSHKLQWFTLFSLITAQLFICANSKPIELNLEEPISTAPLKPGFGYLLLYVDVGATKAFVNFRGSTVINAQGVVEQSGPIDYKLWLDNPSKQFYFIHLPEGQYQIADINAPLYDYSYSKDFAQKQAWQFAVVASKTNFIGELYLDAKRSKNSIKYNLYNRFATYQNKIQTQLKDIVEQYPLKPALSYRDDFFEFQRSVEGDKP